MSDNSVSNYKWFTSNLDDLMKLHHGKWLSIKKKSVIGVYDSFDKAVMTTLKSHAMGSFIVQQCVPQEPE